MPTAYSLIRSGPHYRASGFEAGLAACGYAVKTHFSRSPQQGDVLVIWNRYGSFEDRAYEFERIGARVVVAENGYIGADDQGRRLYALSLGQHHHGGAVIPPGVHVSPEPWRASGRHILVCGQRGIGSVMMRSPPEWGERVVEALSRLTRRPIRLREHPGKDPPKVPLADDLRDCHAVVVWSSAAGIEALMAGIPVFYAAPRWIGEASALRLHDVLAGRQDIEQPRMDAYPAGLRNALGNQWSIDQIASGEAFRCLSL